METIIHTSQSGTEIVLDLSGRGRVYARKGGKMVMNIASGTKAAALPDAMAKAIRSGGMKPGDFVAFGAVALHRDAMPAMESALATLKSHQEANDAARNASIEAVIPGLGEIRAAMEASEEASQRHGRAWIKAMESEDGDGVRMPASPSPALAASVKELAAKYPRAALYLRAERISQSTTWADAAGAGQAARACLAILKSGGPTEEAAAKIADR